jgi:hypothetical protein
MNAAALTMSSATLTMNSATQPTEGLAVQANQAESTASDGEGRSWDFACNGDHCPVPSMARCSFFALEDAIEFHVFAPLEALPCM